jgi:hypothetical protein
MKTYGWKRDMRVDANDVMRELEALGVSERGVTPEQMEEAARSPDSVLHPLLTWDNDTAATQWRIHECGKILRNLVVIEQREREEIIVRAVVRSAAEDERKGRYWEVERALTDADLARGVLADAARDSYAMAQKYRGLSHYSTLLTQYADRLEGLGDWIQSEIPKLSDGNADQPQANEPIIKPLRITKADIRRSKGQSSARGE